MDPFELSSKGRFHLGILNFVITPIGALNCFPSVLNDPLKAVPPVMCTTVCIVAKNRSGDGYEDVSVANIDGTNFAEGGEVDK